MSKAQKHPYQIGNDEDTIRRTYAEARRIAQARADKTGEVARIIKYEDTPKVADSPIRRMLMGGENTRIDMVKPKDYESHCRCGRLRGYGHNCNTA